MGFVFVFRKSVLFLEALAKIWFLKSTELKHVGLVLQTFHQFIRRTLSKCKVDADKDPFSLQ